MPPAFKSFTLALIQLGKITSNKQDNLQHARDMILKAANNTKKPDLIVLPECFNSPYGHKYFPAYAENIAFSRGTPYDVNASESETVKMLSAVAKQTGTWLIGGSIPERDLRNDATYNTCTVYNPEGQLISLYRKMHLFDIDMPGQTFKESETLAGGQHLAIFDTEFARIGLGICYDLRFPELAMIMARKGCHVLIYPGAFNPTTGPLHWELLQRGRALDNLVFVSACSPARDLSADYLAYGHSMVVDPMGRVLSEANEDEETTFTVIDAQVMEQARKGIPVTTQRRFDVYADISECTDAKNIDYS
jgi:omega-amidase